MNDKDKEWVDYMNVGAGALPTTIVGELRYRQEQQSKLQKQMHDNAIAAANSGGGVGSSGYEMLPFTEAIMEAIPRWAYLLFAIVGGVAAFQLNSASTGGAGSAVVGAIIGGVIVQLAILLIDLVIQIAWALLKVALFLGVFAGIIWGLDVLLR